MRTGVCVSIAVGLVLLLSAPAGATERVSLNGEWEVLRSESQSPDGLAIRLPDRSGTPPRTRALHQQPSIEVGVPK